MHTHETEFVILDVETTGLDPLSGDRIIEIAAKKIKNRQVVDIFQSFINPQREIPLEAQQINNITEAMIADAPFHDVVLPQVLQFIGGACLVGHNIGFDLKFLCYELSLLGRKLNEATPALDTLKMSKRFLPQLTSHRLENIAIFLGVKIKETHRALADVELTAAVLRHFINMAAAQKVATFKQLVDEFSVIKPVFKIEQVHQEFLF